MKLALLLGAAASPTVFAQKATTPPPTGDGPRAARSCKQAGRLRFCISCRRYLLWCHTAWGTGCLYAAGNKQSAPLCQPRQRSQLHGAIDAPYFLRALATLIVCPQKTVMLHPRAASLHVARLLTEALRLTR